MNNLHEHEMQSLIEVLGTMQDFISNNEQQSALNTLVHAAMELTGANYAAIAQWDERTDEFSRYAPPHAGQIRWLNHFKESVVRLSRHVFDEQKPQYIPDTHLDERVHQDLIDFGIRSLIGLPIGKHGILYVYSVQPDFFTSANQSVLTLLAGLADLAIRNDQLSRREQALSDAGDKINQQNIDDLPNIVLDLMREFVFYDTASIQWLSDDNTLEIIGGRGFPEERMQKREVIGRTFSVDSPLTPNGHVILSRQPLVLRDAAEQYPSFATAPHDRIKAWIGVPMIVGEKVLGMLTLDREKAGLYTDEHGKMVRVFASYTAIALRNATLLSQRNKRVTELEDLQKFGNDLAVAVDAKQVTDIIAKEFKRLLNANSVAVWPYNPSRQSYDSTHMSMVGISNEVVEQERAKRQDFKWARLDLDGAEIQFVVVDDANASIASQDRAFFNQNNIRCYYKLALKGDTGLIGSIYLNYSDEAQAKSAYHSLSEVTLPAFTAEAALAIKKVLLYSQLQKSRDLLIDTSEAIHNATDAENTVAMLKRFVDGVQKALECDAVTLYRYDSEQRALIGPPITVGLKQEEKTWDVAYISSQSPPAQILNLSEGEHFTDHSKTDPIMKGNFVDREEIESSGGIALRVGGSKEPHIVGVLFLNYLTYHHFNDDEKALFRAFASQAASAIYNIELYGKLQERQRHQDKLIQASQDVVISHNEAEALNIILECALDLVGITGTTGLCAYIQTYDKYSRELVLDQICPSPIELKPEAYQPIVIDHASGGYLGTIAQAINTRKPILLTELDREAEGYDFMALHPKTRCKIIVPMVTHNQVTRLLSVEHKDIGGLDALDLQSLKNLAATAVLAIQKSETQTLLKARTALVSMQFGYIFQQHDISRHASRIIWEIDRKIDRSTLLPHVAGVIQFARDHANTISLLSASRAVLDEGDMDQPVVLNEVIQPMAQKIWNSALHRPVDLIFHLYDDDRLVVKVNPVWLERGFGILIDNAIKSMGNDMDARLKITTEVRGNKVRCLIADEGPGIPEDVRPKLFHDRVPSRTGLGIGLFMAYKIFQAFSGKIHVEDTGPKGTIMAVTLPLYAPEGG